jgi:hypothetical protein
MNRVLERGHPAKIAAAQPAVNALATRALDHPLKSMM